MLRRREEEEEEEEEETDGDTCVYGVKRERADRGPTAGHGEADRAREAGKEARRRKATLTFLLLRCSPSASNLYLRRTESSPFPARLPPWTSSRTLGVFTRASLLRATVDQRAYGLHRQVSTTRPCHRRLADRDRV